MAGADSEEPDAPDADSPLERMASYGRAVAGAPLVLWMTAATSAAVVATSGLGPPVVDRLVRLWARSTVRLFGVEVEASGLENQPSAPAIYLFNHQSHMDVPAIYSVIQRTLRAGAKIELFRIPVFGRAMRAAGVLPIARRNASAVVSVYHAAAERFAEGYSYLLAPEGTRQDEPRIGAFKKGPFRFAIDSQVEVVPIVIKGTYRVLPKGTLAINAGRWRRTVRLQILPPIPTRGLGADDVTRLRDQVHQRMVAAFEAL